MSAFSNDITVEPGLNPLVVDGSAVVQPVSGTVAVSNPGLTDTQLRATPVPVSGPLTDAQLRATPVPVSGTVSTTPSVSSTTTVTQITSTGANQTLLAANANRKRFILYFSTGIWNVKFGVGASGTSRTLQVTSNNYLLEIASHTGPVDAQCTSTGKLVDVTELV